MQQNHRKQPTQSGGAMQCASCGGSHFVALVILEMLMS